MSVIIVQGPRGCGKTFHSAKIAENLGCNIVVDEDELFTKVAWRRLRSKKRILLLCVVAADLPAFMKVGAKILNFSAVKPRRVNAV